MKTPTSASNEIATINEINFGQLYIRHLAKTHYHPKPASEWDNKARSFKKPAAHYTVLISKILYHALIYRIAKPYWT